MTSPPAPTPPTPPAALAEFGIPHPRPFSVDIHVDTAQLSDTVDHVSNVEYVRWLDRAAERHADSLGYTRQRMLEEGRMWFVARHEIDYVAEAGLGDRLVMATWVRDMQRVKSWRDYLLVRPADSTVIVRAATLWVYVDLARRRPTRIPAAMSDRFDPLHLRPGRSCTSR